MTILRTMLAISTTALFVALTLPSTAPQTLSYITGQPPCTTKDTATHNSNVARPTMGDPDAWFTIHRPMIPAGFGRSARDDMMMNFMMSTMITQPPPRPSPPKASPAQPATIATGKDVLAVSTCS